MSSILRLFWNIFNPLWSLLQWIWKYIQKPLLRLTAFLRITWYLFPAILFLIITWACFWQIAQGKDVLIDMLEKKYTGGIVLLAVLFFTLVSWYSSRVLMYRKKEWLQQNETLATHLPRLIGFLGFSFIWIALLSLPEDACLSVSIPGWANWALLGASLVWYLLLYRLFRKLRDGKWRIFKNMAGDSQALLDEKEKEEKKRFNTIYIITGSITLLLFILNTLIRNAWLTWCSIFLLQIVFVFIVVIRRGRMPLKTGKADSFEMPLDHATIQDWQQAEAAKGNHFSIGVWERVLYNANIPQKEKWFFVTYNIITALSLIVYFTTIFSYSFSVLLGSFATVLISFGVLVGFFCIVTFASVVLKVNFHMVLWILIIILGKIFEPHWAKLVDAKDPGSKVFDARPTLYTYFDKWVNMRQADIEKDTAYPVFFVLADGGASRSGYWTASVLSQLEDSTHGKFSNHLFCLSGASGGSVGNGTFLALLKYRDALAKAHQSFTKGAQEFLRSDFLTYTVARTLGPDVFRPIFPLPFVNDRAAALEDAMQHAETSFLQGKFNTMMSDMIPFTTGNEQLPMICINTTRMQDGRPSVISTIKLDSGSFNKRRDILTHLDKGKDMKLSTAVVMGARFPYLSPAGRIDNSYYVDGGYFDNSGAGIVNEMLMAINDYITGSIATRPWLAHVKFYVIHAQNGWSGGEDISKVHPIVNDLAAPILTLVGAYGTQTSVNDWRLIKYMEAIHKDSSDEGYIPVNLYSPLTDSTKTNAAFPMNWVISEYYIRKMDTQLGNVDMKRLYTWLHRRMQW
ncbi:MAG: patatin-like phospholipase family protein [Bacteroidetes bacterium]|nr:patatin-like phospholipase family protein [Bacteroidota bacterium]